MTNIYYSTPYSLDKDIGGANNAFIERLPADSWICITDGDASFLRPNWGHDIAEVIKRHGRDYDLIGCVTNRLGASDQLYNKTFSEEMNLRRHFDIARQLWGQHGPAVEPIDMVAGVFMLFHKSTWQRVKFRRHTFAADRYFSQDIKRKGGRIGLAKGVYMVHNYRLWETDQQAAKMSTKHLLK